MNKANKFIYNGFISFLFWTVANLILFIASYFLCLGFTQNYDEIYINEYLRIHTGYLVAYGIINILCIGYLIAFFFVGKRLLYNCNSALVNLLSCFWGHIIFAILFTHLVDSYQVFGIFINWYLQILNSALFYPMFYDDILILNVLMTCIPYFIMSIGVSKSKKRFQLGDGSSVLNESNS